MSSAFLRHMSLKADLVESGDHCNAYHMAYKMNMCAEDAIKNIAKRCSSSTRKALRKVVDAMAITRDEICERYQLAKMRCKMLAVADDYPHHGAFEFMDAVQKKRLVLGQSARRYKEALVQAQKSFKPSESGGGGGGGGGGGRGAYNAGGTASSGSEFKPKDRGTRKWLAAPPPSRAEGSPTIGNSTGKRFDVGKELGGEKHNQPNPRGPMSATTAIVLPNTNGTHKLNPPYRRNNR